VAYTVSSTYPTEDVTDINLNLTPIDEKHFNDGCIEKQHHVFKYTRTEIVNECFDRVRGSSTTQVGFWTKELAVGTPFLATGGNGAGTSILFTPDDYDAHVTAVVRVRYQVVGASGNNGNSTVTLDDGTGPFNVVFSKVAGSAWSWHQSTQALDKLTSDIRVRLYLDVDDVNDKVECSHLLVYVQEQVAIGA